MRIEHQIINNIEQKQCFHCKQWLPLDNYHKDKSKWDGLCSYCKNCKKEKDHETYLKSPRKYNPYNPKYYSSLKSRMKKQVRSMNRRFLMRQANAKEKITLETITALKEKYNNKCAYCGVDCSDYYEIDHKLPLSRGGDNSFDNLAISCKKCNRSKYTKTDIEFCGHSV